jgi:hypothetical protein
MASFSKARFTIDPSKKPKAIDYDITDGLAKGKKRLGIYELSGDTVNSVLPRPGTSGPRILPASQATTERYSGGNARRSRVSFYGAFDFPPVLECGSPMPLSIRPMRHRSKHISQPHVL